MEKYDKLKILGKGAFGKVYKVRHKENGKISVMKVYSEKRYTDDLEDAAELSMSLRHPNLMRCETFFFDRITIDNWKSSVHLVTILEYIKGQDLQQVIDYEPLTESQMDLYLPQLVSGLKYLHGKRIIHRDIKPENIMIFGMNLKLIDYDFLIDRTVVDVNVGTPYYCSPEIFANRYYNYRTDLWSLGVTIYVCLTGKPPFDAENKKELKALILSDYHPDYTLLGYKYQQICRGLLRRDVRIRLSLNEVLSIL